jgi:ABC-2 type transport system permease protein
MNTNMSTNTMKWLLRREFWEHKGSMFWAPLVVGTLLVVLLGCTIMYAVTAHGLPAQVMVNGQTLAQASLDGLPPAEAKVMVAMIATGMYMGAAAPLFAILTGVVFFYCLGALYDERRDRSILFWKSLPVSDPATVLSKAVTAMVVAPVITLALAVAASLALLFIACTAFSMQGLNLFTLMLASPDLYLAPLRLAALLPVYVVWALPTVGWLMLVSSWAKSKPILWAVGVPVVVLVAIKWINAALENLSGQTLLVAHYASDVVARILGGTVPGIWFTFQPGLASAVHTAGQEVVDMNALVTQSYLSLAGLDAWIGVAMGVAMLYAAIRMRRWRDEG